MAYDYDIAISFLGRDEPVAVQVREALLPLRVFVYSKAQEQVAGREGVEAFRDVFRSRALVSLVLFRPRWGQTPWTRVEETAIRDHCLEAGWDHLMFVRLENEGEIPKWVPDSYIYLDFESFSMSDLVGAIKMKCAKLGVELRPPSAVDRARKMATEEKLKQETEQVLRTTAQPLYDAVATLFAAIERRLAEVEKETGWTILRDSEPREFVAFMDRTSIQLECRWEPNTALEVGPPVRIGPRAEILFRVVYGRMSMPRERRAGLLIHLGEESERSNRKLKLVRLPEHGWCWDDSGRALSAEALAEDVVSEFISTRGTGSSDPWDAE